MYLNNMTLTGFLGGDAETRTTQSNSRFTVLSLATKNSWKDRETGEWASSTQWHRAVVFGRLSDFATTLKKGDHVQINGQLRTREYTEKVGVSKKPVEVKKSITEIRVASIVKLYRSQSAHGAPSSGGAVA